MLQAKLGNLQAGIGVITLQNLRSKNKRGHLPPFYLNKIIHPLPPKSQRSASH